MIRTVFRYSALLAGALVLGACELDVKNPNDPGTAEVLATPKDAEALLGSYYRRWHEGLYRSRATVNGMAAVQSFENYSSLANDCQNARAGIPRPANDNSIANVCAGEQSRLYFISQEVTRVATNILNQLNSTGFTLGSPAQDLRAKAFAEFLRGLSLGYVALFYDKGAIITPVMAGDDPGTLSSYTDVMTAAIAALDEAIVHTQASAAASAATAGGEGFPIPQAWIPTTSSLSAANFERLVRSYRARFRANVARTPAERAAVDWTAVIADATAGITADHDHITSTTAGPFSAWVDIWQGYGLWHQMPAFVIGMADESGSYAAWTALSIDQRGAGGPFFMVTSDLRFPQGTSRPAQFADFQITSCDAAASQCKRYFANRPTGSDQSAGLGWGLSNYDFVRYHPWDIAGDAGSARNGKLPFMTKVEIDMLAAEGHIRSGTPAGFAAAAALINISRTRGMVGGVATGGGLPPVLGTADGGLPAVGLPGCIPKMPVNATSAGGGTVTCGNLMEAMKYEKRIESLQSHFGAWFLDMRGWGDIAVGTPLQWAVPFQDLQARREAIYSMGLNTDGGSAAALGTYGW